MLTSTWTAGAPPRTAPACPACLIANNSTHDMLSAVAHTKEQVSVMRCTLQRHGFQGMLEDTAHLRLASSR